ncbi:uncharacterized protein LOC142078565 isoform X1 [Calonectris borealis]|uniref:uncharacterized protein LOC142078565 isoform X1 n=1 Tax=Calonectris borealis TaxID=1323832 RepID=UPI003F4BC5B4
MWGCPSLPADAGLQQAAKQPGGAGDGEGPCSHLHRQHPWRAASLAALSLPGMQEGGAKEAATCSPGLRKHEGLVPSLLAGLARSSLHVRGEAPAAPAEQVPLAVLRGQSCSRVPADGAWSEPSQQRLRELLRCSRPDPGGREERGRLPAPSCPAMAKEEEHPSALSDNQVFALTCIYLPASLLSLLGSGSVLAVTSRQRRCCHIQLRPLFLLALADFLAAAVLLSTATIQLLPAPLFIPAYAACPYGLMLATTFYSVSFLMVVVYAYEAYRTVHGWRARHVAALQERSGCLASAWQGLPYILAWLVPALTLLGRLMARGTSLTDIAPRPLEPVVPWKGNRSHETYSLYCSSCLLLIRRAQDICYAYVGRKDVGLEGKIIFFLYLLLVLSCCTLLYRRVKLRCRRNAAAPLLTPEKDGFAGRSIRSVSKVSHYFQLVFLLCWAPGKSEWGCPAAPAALAGKSHRSSCSSPFIPGLRQHPGPRQGLDWITAKPLGVCRTPWLGRPRMRGEPAPITAVESHRRLV